MSDVLKRSIIPKDRSKMTTTRTLPKSKLDNQILEAFRKEKKRYENTWGIPASPRDVSTHIALDDEAASNNS